MKNFLENALIFFVSMIVLIVFLILTFYGNLIVLKIKIYLLPIAMIFIGLSALIALVFSIIRR